MAALFVAFSAIFSCVWSPVFTATIWCKRKAAKVFNVSEYICLWFMCILQYLSMTGNNMDVSSFLLSVDKMSINNGLYLVFVVTKLDMKPSGETRLINKEGILHNI